MFWYYLVTSKQIWNFFQIFVAFIEYLSFELFVTKKRTQVSNNQNSLFFNVFVVKTPNNKLPWHFPLVLFVARTCQIGREVSNMVQSQNWPPKDPKVIWCLCYGSKHYINLPLNKESAVIDSILSLLVFGGYLLSKNIQNFGKLINICHTKIGHIFGK